MIFDFEIKTGHPILASRVELVFIKKKKRTCQLVDFVVSADQRVKIKVTKRWIHS